MDIKKPTVSIIIPTLNEADTLPQLLKQIEAQEKINLEVIVVDGGSTDDSLKICNRCSNESIIDIKCISTATGRGHQMNAGAQLAQADELLFLHADSSIDSNSLISNAYDFIEKQRMAVGNSNIAGHFGIRFIPSGLDSKGTNDYYFYESKTHLNRPDCINGDQGFWLAKDFFQQLGGFDESLAYMEDAKLALKIFETGIWLTLPGTLGTSARRFEIEGYTKRQILNSFLCNFNAMGVTEFFRNSIDVYRNQSDSEPLKLRPFLKLAHYQINCNGLLFAVKRWYLTGSYIASNSWQLAYAWDCRKNKKLGLEPGAGNFPWLRFYDARLAPAAQWPLTKAITAAITILWFYSLFVIK